MVHQTQLAVSMTRIEMLRILGIFRLMNVGELKNAKDFINEELERSRSSQVMRNFVRAAELCVSFMNGYDKTAREAAMKLSSNPLADDCLHAILFFNGDHYDTLSRRVRWLGFSGNLYAALRKEVPFDEDREEIMSEILMNENLVMVELRKIACS